MEREFFLLLLMMGWEEEVGGGAMIRHYVSQPKRQGSNVSTKCQVALLVSWLAGFFCSFFYLIIGLSKE